MCPLIRDLAAASVCCGSGTLRADIKACVFYIWQAPDPGPPALTVHLSKTIRFPTVTNPAWTFLAYTWEGGGKIQARVSASRRRICLFTAAALTEMLLERHGNRLDLVCLRVTTSNIRVSFFFFPETAEWIFAPYRLCEECKPLAASVWAADLSCHGFKT